MNTVLFQSSMWLWLLIIGAIASIVVVATVIGLVVLVSRLINDMQSLKATNRELFLMMFPDHVR